MMRLPRPQCISHGAPLMPSHVADDEIARHHALKNKIAFAYIADRGALAVIPDTGS